MDLLSIGAIVISGSALLINYLSYRHNKNNDLYLNQREQLNDMKDNYIDLNNKYNKASIDIEVMKIKVEHEVELLNKLEEKIDQLMEKI